MVAGYMLQHVQQFQQSNNSTSNSKVQSIVLEAEHLQTLLEQNDVNPAVFHKNGHNSIVNLKWQWTSMDDQSVIRTKGARKFDWTWLREKNDSIRIMILFWSNQQS